MASAPGHGQEGPLSSALHRSGGKCCGGSPGPSPQSCRELCLLLLDGEAPALVSAQRVGRQHISEAREQLGLPGRAVGQPHKRGLPSLRGPGFPMQQHMLGSRLAVQFWELGVFRAGWDAAGTGGS